MTDAYQIQEMSKRLNATLEKLKAECADRKWCIDQALTFCLEKAELDPIELAGEMVEFITKPLNQAQKQIEDFLKSLV